MDFNATFIVAFFSFIIFIFVMNSVLYKPINDIVQKRKNLIDENYGIAKNNSAKANAILEQKEQELKKAKNIAKEKMLNTLELQKQQNAKILNEAKENSKIAIKENAKNLEVEMISSKDELKLQIISLAQAISDKLIKSDIKINPDIAKQKLDGMI